MPRKQTQDQAKQDQPSGATAPAVTDDQGQVNPDGPQGQPNVAFGRGVIPTQRYGQGEGFDVGQVATKTVWRNEDNGKAVTKEPERGTVLATKGDVVRPAEARALKDAGFKG